MQDDAKAVRAFDFRVKTCILYCAHCLIRFTKASCGSKFPRMKSIQGQSGQEENNFCFWFLTDGWWKYWFCPQNLANNRIFGDDLVVFSGKVHLPINTRVKKSSFGTCFNHVYGSLKVAIDFLSLFMKD